MAILRTQSRLFSRTPPPSPIATAKGLKSAAVNDQILSEYLEKTLHIPDLTLPESYFSANDHRRIPVEIDFSSLKSRDDDSIRQLLESVTELGVFRLIGHGISADELQSTIAEAELVFRISKEKKKRNLSINIGSKNVSRDEFFWSRSGKETSVTLRDEIGSEKYQILSRKMDDIYDKLEAVAESVGQILFEYITEPVEKRNQERESVLFYYRYSSSSSSTEHDQSGHEENNIVMSSSSSASDHHGALSLYIYVGDQKFHINTGKGLLSCKTCSGTIVVTVRKQLEEWSQGKFKCVTGEPIVAQSIHVNPSYAIEFMFSPPSSTLYYNSNRKIKSISIFDQILIAIIIAFLYTFFTYISSILKGE
ncbi:Non-heme dioxygenase N-terminal domain [Macleaya cordata]|uniref:Non-heme dioxygenase N-terminal domain n=1 Tax=Macleaya cordata TaxID=56857 RepID=A0A200RAB5_MACCD|nr:Non-heme dioxygenase N-terminal domain [Macleaya cordata]